MPIDANIALGYQAPKFTTPADLLSLQNVARQGQMQQVQLEEAQANQAKKNSLRQILQGSTDPTTGRLTPQGLSAITQIDPEMGLNLTGQQEKLRLQDLAFNEKKNEIVKHVGTSYVQAYDRYLQQTSGNKERAQELATRDALSSIDEMQKSGTLRLTGMDEQTIANLRKLPPPEQARATVTALGGKIEEQVKPGIRTERKRIVGSDEVQEEWNPETKTWKEIGRGPRFASSVEQKIVGVPPELSQFTGEEYLKKLPSGEASLIKGIAEGRISPNTLSIRGGHREKVLQQVSQYDPMFDATNYNARAGVRKDFTSGPTSKNVTAINTAIGHIGTLDELGDALKNKDTRVLNAVFNKIATETGNPNVNNLEVAVDAVATELMRVFRQVNASEAETREWAAKFKAANSPAQLKGAAKTAAELLQSRIEAVDDQWKRGMQTDKGFPDLLSPKSQKVMSKVKSYGNTPAEANGGPYSDAEKEKRYQEWKAKQR